MQKMTEERTRPAKNWPILATQITTWYCIEIVRVGENIGDSKILHQNGLQLYLACRNRLLFGVWSCRGDMCKIFHKKCLYFLCRSKSWRPALDQKSPNCRGGGTWSRNVFLCPALLRKFSSPRRPKFMQYNSTDSTIKLNRQYNKAQNVLHHTSQNVHTGQRGLYWISLFWKCVHR